MSIEEEIQIVEELVKDIEIYVETGVWNPERQIQVAAEIVKADKDLRQLMMGHSMKIDILSEEQVSLVSNLLKRLTESKDKLPSPPV